MNLLKKLPWFTIIVAGIAVLKFYPEIKTALEKNFPSGSKFLFNSNTPSE